MRHHGSTQEVRHVVHHLIARARLHRWPDRQGVRQWSQPAWLHPTTVLGIVGSLLGGFLGYVIFDKNPTEGVFQGSGIFGSVIGAMIVLFIYRRRAAR